MARSGPSEIAAVGENRPELEDETSVSRFLLYTLSLPERVVRSTVGVAAGAAREAAQALVPQAFQTSKTYEVVVVNSLKFLTENVGGVETASPRGNQAGSDRYLARKAVGSFVDFAGLATLHLSPLWMFAIVSDVAYGSRSYVHELAAELRRRGLIRETSTIDRVDDLLSAIGTATSETASLLDAPPLSVEQLRLSLERTKAAVQAADPTAILPESELRHYWEEMRAIAAREEVSLLGVSGALTLHMFGKAGVVAKGGDRGRRRGGRPAEPTRRGALRRGTADDPGAGLLRADPAKFGAVRARGVEEFCRRAGNMDELVFHGEVVSRCEAGMGSPRTVRIDHEPGDCKVIRGR